MTLPLSLTDSPRAEGADLQEHCLVCRRQQGRLHALRCAGEGVRGWLAPRLVTLLVLLGAVWLAVSAWWPAAA